MDADHGGTAKEWGARSLIGYPSSKSSAGSHPERTSGRSWRSIQRCTPRGRSVIADPIHSIHILDLRGAIEAAIALFSFGCRCRARMAGRRLLAVLVRRCGHGSSGWSEPFLLWPVKWSYQQDTQPGQIEVAILGLPPPFRIYIGVDEGFSDAKITSWGMGAWRGSVHRTAGDMGTS